METNHQGAIPTKYATGFLKKPRGLAKLKSLAVAAVLTATLNSALAELIPANRLTNWTPGVTVGVPGGIPTNRTNIIDVTQAPYNADKTGASNAASAIQTAITNAPAGAIVYLPAGTYRLDSALSIAQNDDGITLRGAGTDKTTLLVMSSSTGINVGVATDYNWAYPSSGNVVTGVRTKDTTDLAIANTSAFAVGQIVQVSVSNQQDEAAIQAGAAPVVHVSSWGNMRRMKARVVAKTATTVTISPGLIFDCSNLTTTLNAAQAQTDNVGLEDFSLTCNSAATTTGIQFEQVYGSWIKNVKVNRAANYAFFFWDSLNCEIRRSYANQRFGEGTNGAGILCNASSACLFEDNIVYKFFPLLEVNFGSSGNVVAYNLFEDSRVYGSLGSAINTNHGPHNSYNLYEGNISPNVQADGYFGSVSEDTIFRNWLHGTVYDRSTRGAPVCLNRLARNYSIVGNVIGLAGTTGAPYSFGNPNMGNGNSTGTAQATANKFWGDWSRMKTAANGQGPGPGGFQELDLDVQRTTILKGNYVYATGGVPASESLGSDSLPDSLYLSGKPAWFGNLTWPAFGPSTATSVRYEAIPAGYRFVNGVDPDGSSAPAPNVAPSFVSQPQSASRVAGDSSTLNTVVAGSPTPSLQWYKNGALISGATSATLSLSNLQLIDAGNYTVVASNSAGTVTSSTAIISINLPSVNLAPAFTAQPSSVSVASGGSATFSAAASGLPAPSYQWSKNGSAISGATNAAYTIASVSSNDAATYTVTATNLLGTVTSNGAVLTLTTAPSSSAPVITTQPTNVTAPSMSTATFSVAATGSPAPSYQWRKNGTAINGWTSPTLTLNYISVNDAATFTCVVSNAGGSVVSNPVTLSIGTSAPTQPTTSAPVITTQPTARTVTAGASTTFTVAASGTPTPTYQWRKNGANISGATSSSYTLSSVAAGDAGSYTVVATNSVGSATSNAVVLTVTTPSTAPVITSQPTNTSVAPMSTATFTVVASGTPAPTYQWRKNGTAISGWTSPTLTLKTVSTNDSASYTCVITNSGGSVTSNAATLTVSSSSSSITAPPPTSSSAPVITTQPASSTVAPMSTATFTVVASGTPAPTYQWRKNGTAISGWTSPTLTLTSVSTNDNASFTCVVTNSAGSVTSLAATLNVSAAAPKALAAMVQVSAPAKVAADFNQDGQTDLIWQNTRTGQTGIVTAGASFSNMAMLPVVSTTWLVKGNGDFNNDGQVDFLWENTSTKEYGVMLMQGTKGQVSATIGSTKNGSPIAAGDFNGDGKVDILWQNANGSLVIQIMNGTTKASEIALGAFTSGARIAGVADLNGDGKADLLWDNVAKGTYGVQLMNGTTYGSNLILGNIRTGKVIAGSGDFNVDGKADIIWQNLTTGEREIVLMNGTTMSSVLPYGTFPAEWVIRN